MFSYGGPAEIGPFIPIIGIIGVLALAIVRTIMRADVRKLELRAQIKQMEASSQTASPDITGLRAELAQLRDTSTQYDVSLQHTLERLDQRLTFLEKKVADASTALIETKADNVQQINRQY